MRGVLGSEALLAGAVLGIGVPASLQEQPPPRLRTSTQVVQVDVRVHDEAGRFVEGLTADDFEVRENGVLQRLSSLTLVRGDARGSASSTESSEVRVVPANRTWIFLIDQRHIGLNGFHRTKESLRTFLAERMDRADAVGIVMDDKMINNRITPNPEEYLAALDTFGLRDESGSRSRDAVDAETAAGGHEDSKEALLRAVGTERERAARAITETIDKLAKGLAAVPGEKILVLFSDGWALAKIDGTLRTAVERLNRTGVRVYAVDTRGLSGAPADTLNSLALDTGGMVLFNENNIGRALDAAVADTKTYYLLGYHPANEKLDGKYRSIAVTVKRPGVYVRARRGYAATQNR